MAVEGIFAAIMVAIGAFAVQSVESSTNQNNGTIAASTHHHHLQIFAIELDHVSMPLTISVWLFVVTLAKIVFHLSERVNSLFPDSALLIVLGLFFGGILNIVLLPTDIYLRPDIFFLYLLPPIALDAGYFLPNRAFFNNLGTILLYAVVGTLWNVTAIGLTLYLFSGFYPEVTFIDLLLFATLISAVDPVAVLCVFEEIHVNQMLYICVFGESLLNDAVTVVLYHTFGSMVEIGGPNLEASDFVKASSSFFLVALGGIGIGIVWAAITGLVTKYSHHLNVVQPLICLLFPYLAYLLAEVVHMSGILAIVVCGLLMKQYIRGNISRKSLVTVKYFLKTLSSSCEAIIFVFLGLSTISRNHQWNWMFVIITALSCFIYRSMGCFGLTFLVNRGRVEKIGLVDQFIMAYGGLRGAVCYGLVMSLDADLVPVKNMYVTTSVVVILLTVFVQGVTIKPLVYLLKVKREDQTKKTVYEHIITNMQDHIMAGVETIVGYHGHYWLRHKLTHLNANYVQPFLMRKTVNSKIVEYHEALSVKDAVAHLRAHGSFVGLTAYGSRVHLNDMTPQHSNLSVNDYRTEMPRNESLSVIVCESLPPVSPVRRYSRQLLESDIDMSSKQPRLRRYMNRWTNPIEEDADTNTFPLERRCRSLRVPQRRNTTAIKRNDENAPFDKRRRNTLESSNGLSSHEMTKSNEKPVFFISSNNDDRSSSHQQHLEMVPAPQKMRIDIPTVVIDMEEDRDELVDGMPPDEKHALLPIVEQDEGRDID